MIKAAIACDDTLQALALEALAQRDAALTRVTHRARSLEETLDAQYVLVMAERLSLADLEMLGEATSLREAGLQAARDGNLEAGLDLVAAARGHCDNVPLSEEARLSSETFQTAAEAYLRYRRGGHAEAETLLFRSIETSQALATGYGYDFDLRLVHLARNIARVRAEAGRAEDALKLAVQLVRVIEGDSGCWPWPALVGAPSRLSGDASWMAMDQLVTEIALTLRPPGGAALHARAQREGWLDFDLLLPGFGQMYAFIAAYRALAVGDDAQFLRDAVDFFAGGVGNLASSWRCMGADVERIATRPTAQRLN